MIKYMNMKAKRMRKTTKHMDKAAIWMHSDTLWVKTASGLRLSMVRTINPAFKLTQVKLKT